jgi:hypothetical protein
MISLLSINEILESKTVRNYLYDKRIDSVVAEYSSETMIQFIAKKEDCYATHCMFIDMFDKKDDAGHLLKEILDELSRKLEVHVNKIDRVLNILSGDNEENCRIIGEKLCKEF